MPVVLLSRLIKKAVCNSVCGTDPLNRILCLLAPEHHPEGPWAADHSSACVMWPLASLPQGPAAQLWGRAQRPVAKHTAAGLVGGSLGENQDCHTGLAPGLSSLFPLLHQICLLSNIDPQGLKHLAELTN